MTEIIVVGINHKTAPVELREKLAFTESELSRSFAWCAGCDVLAEAVILSTCNRTEIYVSGRDAGELEGAVTAMLGSVKGIDTGSIRPNLYIHTGETAVEHLFKVAAGLDSMVLGETQILGQVKEACSKASDAGTVGSIFHALFRHAVTAAKRVQTETAINRNAASVSFAAVELAKKIFRRLDDSTVLVIGAGKMSELTLRHLYDQGAKKVVVVNRTRSRADQLAVCFGGLSADYGERRHWLARADIVISSTGAPHFVLDREEIASVMRKRRGKPLFLIDIAVPRDIDPRVNTLENVYLYDIDDLQAVVAANMKERENEARKAGVILKEEMAAFYLWFKTREVVPLISALRRKAETIRLSELEVSLKKLNNLSDREKKHVENLTRAIVNRILREPVLRIKEFAVADKSDIYVASLCQLFDLEEEINGSSPKWEDKAGAEGAGL